MLQNFSDDPYKLHLLVDVQHEVALAYHVTDTKAGDNDLIPELVAQAQQNLPPERIKTLTQVQYLQG